MAFRHVVTKAVDVGRVYMKVFTCELHFVTRAGPTDGHRDRERHQHGTTGTGAWPRPDPVSAVLALALAPDESRSRKRFWQSVSASHVTAASSNDVARRQEKMNLRVCERKDYSVMMIGGVNKECDHSVATGMRHTKTPKLNLVADFG